MITYNVYICCCCCDDCGVHALEPARLTFSFPIYPKIHPPRSSLTCSSWEAGRVMGQRYVMCLSSDRYSELTFVNFLLVCVAVEFPTYFLSLFAFCLSWMLNFGSTYFILFYVMRNLTLCNSTKSKLLDFMWSCFPGPLCLDIGFPSSYLRFQIGNV